MPAPDLAGFYPALMLCLRTVVYIRHGASTGEDAITERWAPPLFRSRGSVRTRFRTSDPGNGFVVPEVMISARPSDFAGMQSGLVIGEGHEP